MKPANASQMRDHIKAFLNRLCRKFKLESEYRIEKMNDRKLRLYTDGTIYGFIYDTTANELPQLMRDANEEFKGNAKIPKADEYYNQFVAIVEKYGWHVDHYGGGILEIYKMTE